MKPFNNPTLPRPFTLLGGLVLAGAASMLALPAQAQSRLTIPSANVTASSSDANVPGNANDGSLSTRWSADATTAPQWLQYQLGGCYKISSAQLAWYNGDTRKYNFTLQVSNDGSGWTDASAGSNSGTSAGLESYTLGDRSAKYLRLQSTGSDVNKLVGLSEMQVWTNGAGTCNSSALDPSKPPGVNFDLSGFKLQTFDSALNVKEVKVIGSYSDQYFYTDPVTGAMTFYVPSGAGATVNSDFPRSELRGISTWRIGVTRTLAVSAMVLQQPATRSIIIGQIHGEQTGGSELLKLRWTKGDILMGVKPSYGDIEQKILIKSGVALGENIDYVIKMVGSTVTVTVNGVAKSFTYNTASWSAIDLYFKVGNYSQDSAADGTVAKVAVTALAVGAGPQDVSASVQMTQQGATFNRVTGKYVGSVTVSNTSGAALAGPLQLKLNALTSGLTLDNASGIDAGAPYITVPGPLNAGATVSVPLTLTNPARTVVSYTPVFYQGNF